MRTYCSAEANGTRVDRAVAVTNYCFSLFPYLCLHGDDKVDLCG